MGAMKELMMNLQQEFAEYKFIKDGCPEADAKKEDWESMVTSFFDGDEAAAMEEFTIWHGGGHPTEDVDVDDMNRCMSLDIMDKKLVDLHEEEDEKNADDMASNQADDDLS